MKASDLKAWIDTVHPESQIEIERYGWDALDPKKIRATYQSAPPVPDRTMAEICNVEDAK